MSDDIVTRLRTTLAHADDVYDTMNEAADEIERLRTELYRWRRIADVCVIAIGIPENDTSRLAVELYDKAVRGE